MWGAGWPESPTCGFPHPKATKANLEKFLRDQSVYLRQHFRKRETRLVPFDEQQPAPPPHQGPGHQPPVCGRPAGPSQGVRPHSAPTPLPPRLPPPTAHHTGHPGLPSPGRTKRRSPGKVSNALFTRTVAVRTDGTAGTWEGLVGVGSSARSGPGQYLHTAPTSSCPGWVLDPTLPTCRLLLFWQKKTHKKTQPQTLKTKTKTAS